MNLEVNSIYKILEQVMDNVASGTKVIFYCGSSKGLVRKAVELGAFGVVVDSDYLVDARKLVADEEAKLILSVR